jgi:DNA (cytosine-5)-methyltransferase 1
MTQPVPIRRAPDVPPRVLALCAGWVTAVPGIPRKEQLRILGNGVVPQQAHHAYGLLTGAHSHTVEGRTTA